MRRGKERGRIWPYLYPGVTKSKLESQTWVYRYENLYGLAFFLNLKIVYASTGKVYNGVCNKNREVFMRKYLDDKERRCVS